MTTATRNGTRFAAVWLEANAALMDAIADPCTDTFTEAHALAVAAIGSSFCAGPGSGAVEWDMAQSLAQLVADTARKHGVYLPGCEP